MAKLRKLFTNEEIITALQTHNNTTKAAKELSKLRGVKVTSQLLTYWKKHLEVKRKNGEPFLGTSVLDRQIRQHMALRSVGHDDYARKTDVEEDNTIILIIPDLHAPYQHKDTLAFLSDVKDKLQPTRVISLGDETDGHALSFHDSDPNLDSAGVELHKAQQFLQKLEALFPTVDVCHSNHGSLVYRRAIKYGIPVEYIKSYRDIIFSGNGGNGWRWLEKIITYLPNGDKTIFQHQSAGDILANAAHETANIVQGHEHGKFDLRYRSSTSRKYWGLTSGCLVDNESLSFAYGKLYPNKPIIGVSALIDSQPVLIPMPENPDGRYTRKLGGIFGL